jgi:hypothetical protein
MMKTHTGNGSSLRWVGGLKRLVGDRVQEEVVVMWTDSVV